MDDQQVWEKLKNSEVVGRKRAALAGDSSNSDCAFTALRVDMSQAISLWIQNNIEFQTGPEIA